MAHHTNNLHLRNIVLLSPVKFLHKIRSIIAIEIPKYMKSDKRTRTSAVIIRDFLLRYSLLPKSEKSGEHFSESMLLGKKKKRGEEGDILTLDIFIYRTVNIQKINWFMEFLFIMFY